MNDFLDSLPSVRNLLKLILVLILGLIIIGLLLRIVELIMPLLILAAIVAGGFYLFRKLQANGTI